MSTTEEFAHGNHYGDYWGVVFSTPGEAEGFIRESLSISDMYIDPLFGAIVSKFAEHPIPKIVSEWRDCTGWTETDRAEMSEADTSELIEALANITETDLIAQNEAVCTPNDSFRCAMVITNFLSGLQERKLPIFIEDD